MITFNVIAPITSAVNIKIGRQTIPNFWQVSDSMKRWGIIKEIAALKIGNSLIPVTLPASSERGLGHPSQNRRPSP